MTDKGTPRASVLHVALAMGAIYIVWGSTYLAIRFAIETIPPFLMAGSRYVTAGILLYAWSRLRGAPRPTLTHWRSATLVGAFLLLVGNGGVVWAEQRLSSGLAALLISTEPLWIVLLVWMRSRKERPNGQTVAGLLLGLVGLFLLVKPSPTGGVDLIGAGAILIASLSWAWGSLYGQRAELPESPLLATAMQMLAGGALQFVTAVLLGEPARFDPAAMSAKSLISLAYLVIFGAIVAFTAYSWLLRVASPVLVSTYAYVNPVVAVLLGWAFANEPLTAGTLVAAAVILTGVALITLAQGHKHEKPAPAKPPEPAWKEAALEIEAGR
jgi:drug/metabolite transporter (DMT)-like permease